jgi:putative addiction module component (TIGR02574 family)
MKRGGDDAMTRDANSLLEAALRLSEEDRAELADRLFESLDPDADDGPNAAPGDLLHPAWADEIRRRVEDMKEGRVKGIPWEEVRRRLLDDSDATEAG